MRLHKYNFRKPNLKLLATSLIFVFSSFTNVYSAAEAASSDDEYLSCTDIKIIFARGSGVEVNSARDFLPFSTAINSAFSGSGVSISYYELGSKPDGWGGHTYPAPGVGIQTWQRFETSFGAWVSGGEAGPYGDSVYEGTLEAANYITALRLRCPNTRVILSGYSQGAQLISQLTQMIDGQKIFAALTFGDPKLYLPEGEYDLYYRTTPACYNGKSSFSEYRAYVPDCTAKEGILGGWHPYQPSGYSGKLRTYCQFHDVICSSYIDLMNFAYGHASYDEQGTYARAATDLYNMYFNLPGTPEPARDLAIIIDNTTSSADLLRRFKSEALSLAYKTYGKGGKVSVYYYFVDKTDNSVRIDNLCGGNCRDMNVIRTELQYVSSTYGAPAMSTIDDIASVLRQTSWQDGANKSLVLMTDTRLENPENSNVSRDEIVELAYSIDPVNLYTITTAEHADEYRYLADRSGGEVYVLSLGDTENSSEEAVTTAGDDIIAHEASVVTESRAPLTLSSISNLSYSQTSDDSLRISFDSDGAYYLLTIGEMPAGYTSEKSFEIGELDFSRDLKICLSPASSAGYRGSNSCLEIPGGTLLSAGQGSENQTSSIVVPKAPNTGKI